MSTTKRTETTTETAGQQGFPPGVTGTAPIEKVAPTKEEREKAVTGVFRDARDINSRLKYAAENYNLVSPMTAVGRLPEGFGIAFSMVRVDVRDVAQGGETYTTGGQVRGMVKSALSRIANAAGICIDPEGSRRMDDGSDPSYCAWRAVGTITHFDMTKQTEAWNKQVDLRDGAPALQSMKARLRDPKGSIEKQLREARLFIQELAEAKAWLRVVRSLCSLKSGYLPEELRKPFVVVKLMWTGESEDPELRRRFAELAAIKVLGLGDTMGSAAKLFGAQPVAGLEMPAQAPPRRTPPPPVGATGTGFDDDDVVDQPAATATRTASKVAGPDDLGVPVAKFGKQKGVPLAEIDDDDLDWYIEAIRKSLSDPTKARYRADNQRDMDEAIAVRKALAAGSEVDDEGSDDDGLKPEFEPGDPLGQY